MADEKLMERLKREAESRGVSTDTLLKELLRASKSDALAIDDDPDDAADIELSEDDRLASMHTAGLARGKASTRWNDDDAVREWLESEAHSLGGVLSGGGMTGGGIFGDAPIATERHDPLSNARLMQHGMAMAGVERERTLTELLVRMNRRMDRLESKDRREARRLSGRRGRDE